MKRFVQVILLVAATASTNSLAAQADEDLLSLIAAQPGMAERLGLGKLTEAEKKAWNEVLNLVFRAGSGTAPPGMTPPPMRRSHGAVSVYKTEIVDDDGDVLELSNGAMVEVTTGFLGFIGFRPDAVLFQTGRNWRIWIEGKRTFPVRVLRQPTAQRARVGELVNISEVLGNGAILRLLDGRMLEVDPIDHIYTGIWIGYAEAVLIDGYELLNLDNGELVGITAIR